MTQMSELSPHHVTSGETRIIWACLLKATDRNARKIGHAESAYLIKRETPHIEENCLVAREMTTARNVI